MKHLRETSKWHLLIFKGVAILKTTDIVDVMKQSATESCISKSGDVGTITFMETIANAGTVSDSSARSMNLASGGTLTVSNGSSGKSWITVVALNGTATINFGSSWSWSGSTPTLAKGLVVLAWYGTFGIATFTKFGS